MPLQSGEPRLVLASASAARRAILEAAGVVFETCAAAVDEAAVKNAARAEGIPAEDTTIFLAELKARRVARSHPEALVIGGDQLLVCEGRWFDKPRTMDEARAQLLALRGREHVLVTSVLCQLGQQRLWHHVARPKLRMREFSEAFLDAYLAAEGAAVCACVGAYRLEGPGIQLFERVDGEYAAVLGLPLLALTGFLRQHGVLLR